MSILIVWLSVEIGGAIAIQMVISAIGSLSTEDYTLKAERCQFTNSLAKNVLALRRSDMKVLCSSIQSTWIATAGIL